jgi:hypothetical protein
MKKKILVFCTTGNMFSIELPYIYRFCCTFLMRISIQYSVWLGRLLNLRSGGTASRSLSLRGFSVSPLWNTKCGSPIEMDGWHIVCAFVDSVALSRGAYLYLLSSLPYEDKITLKFMHPFWRLVSVFKDFLSGKSKSKSIFFASNHCILVYSALLQDSVYM